MQPDPEHPSVIDGWLNAPVTGRHAVVNWTPEENLVTLSAGFESAAVHLADEWPAHRDDAMVVPIIYLYRHAVELALKAAIISATTFFDVDYKMNPPEARATRRPGMDPVTGRSR